MHIFVLMVVEVSGQSCAQNLVPKFATSPPWGTVGHNPQRPLRLPHPGNRDQRSGKRLPGTPFRSHSFVIVVWGWNLVLGAKDEVKMTLSLTLSAYIPDRFSIRSVIASLLLRTTISWPKSRRYKTSVPFRGQLQNRHEHNNFRAYHNDWPTKSCLPR